MYATQQAGLTVGGYLVGAIKDTFGWTSLQIFFIILCALGFFLGTVLIGRLGKNFPKPFDERNKEKEGTEEENIEMLQATKD